MPKVNFIKKGFTKREWNEHYSKHDSYFYLETRDGKAYAAFAVVELPRDAEELTDDEMRIFDEYRRRINMRPFPLTGNRDDLPNQMKISTEQEKQETKAEVEKLRESLGYSKKMATNLSF
jgi:hypothetical protein